MKNNVIEKAIAKKKAALKKEVAVELSELLLGKMDDESLKKSRLFSILKRNPDLDMASIDIGNSPNSFMQKMTILLGIETLSNVNIAKNINEIVNKIVDTEAAKEVINLEVHAEEDNRHWYLKTKSTKDGKHKLGLYFRDSIIGLADFFVGEHTSKNAPYELFIQNWNNACDKENIPLFKVSYDATRSKKVRLEIQTEEEVKSILAKGGELTFEEKQLVLNVMLVMNTIEKGLNDIVNLKEKDLKLNTLANAGDLTPKERIIKGLTIAAVCLLTLAIAIFVPIISLFIGDLLFTAMGSTRQAANIAMNVLLSTVVALPVVAIVEVGLSIPAGLEKPYVGSENKEVFENYKKAVDSITKSIDEFEKLPPKKNLSEKELAELQNAKKLLEDVKTKITSAGKEVAELADGVAAEAMGR